MVYETLAEPSYDSQAVLNLPQQDNAPVRTYFVILEAADHLEIS